MKVAVFTGTRAEYGLLFWLLKDIQADSELELQLIVSGTHLSPEFGETYHQIEKDGFIINEKVEVLLSSDSAVGVAKSLGLGVIGYADALQRLNPDMIVILGDRFESFAMAQTSMILRIPIIHLHGGEITEGAYDDSFRHAITKLSYLHGTSTEEYRQRVIQLGEEPSRVKNIGAIGLTHLTRTKLLDLKELGIALGFKLTNPYFLVTYHPVTLADEDPVESFNAILSALDEFPQYQIVITYPNADDGGRKIIPMIEMYSSKNPDRVLAVKSLGHLRYLSAIKYSTLVIGNSSSGIIEVPSFLVPTINVGVRQKGRIAAKSIFNVPPDKQSVSEIIEKVLSINYEQVSDLFLNPYYSGNASSKVIEMIKTVKFEPVKKFYDLNFREQA